MKRTLLLSLSLLWLALPLASAQGINRLFGGLLKSETSDKSTHEPSASEQLVWLKTKMTEVDAQLKTFETEAFQQRLKFAGWTPDRSAEFQSLARRQLETWTSSQNMLEQIVLHESLHDSSEAVAPPTTEEEATLLTNRLRAEEARAQRTKQMIEGSVRLTAATRQSEREASQNFLLTGENVQSPPPDLAPEIQERNALEHDLAGLRLELEKSRLFFLLWQTYNFQLEANQANERALMLARALNQSGFNQLFQKERIQNRLKALEEELPKLEAEAQRISAIYETASTELKTLQKAVEKAAETSQPGLAALRQSLLARLEQNRRLEGIRNIQNYLQELHKIETDLTQEVLSAFNSNQLGDLEKVRDTLLEERQKLRLAQPLLETHIAEIDSSLDALHGQLADTSLSKSRRTDLEKISETTQREKESLNHLFQRLLTLTSTQDQLITEISQEIQTRDWSVRAMARAKNSLRHLGSIWNFPLFAIGGTLLTLGKLLSALVILALSLVLSRILSSKVGHSVTRRFHLAESQTHVIKTLLFYSLASILVLTTLQFLHIPLTAFAFLGGALMVGIGFGSQNLMNNFISGLILLFERKFNIGDLVEADGHFGRITQLGGRCSSIRKPDGVEVLLPNSFFLEKNVANWTLSDHEHRFEIAIGLAYGTPVEKALKVLEEAVHQQPEVLRDPAPLVVFEDFGDSALLFRIYYWLRLGLCDGRIVGSEIRTRIDRLCRENQFEIPFPQQDVNLHLPPNAFLPVPQKLP